LVKGLWDQEYFYEQLKLSKQREQEESGKWLQRHTWAKSTR
jgi:hypothetical protein